MTGATTQGETLRLSAKATGSRLAAFDANEKGRLHGALSHGHAAHVGVHDEPQVAIRSDRRAALHLRLAFPPVNWRGLRSASFSRLHSHWLPSSSQATDRRTFLTSLAGVRRNSPERAVTGCAGAFHSANLAGANRLCVRNTSAHHQLVSAFFDVPHVSRRLSSSPIAWSQPSEALNGRVPNSSGAFQKSEGELPNVCC